MSIPIETALADELTTRVSRILSLSADPKSLAQVARDIQLGKFVAHGFGQPPENFGTQVPSSRFSLLKVGPSPESAVADLRKTVGDELLAAAGLSPVFLNSSATGQSQREASRRFRQYAIAPALKILAAELGQKLEVPGLRITVAENAEEVRARAGALKTLVDAGLPLLEARTLAGF